MSDTEEMAQRVIDRARDIGRESGHTSEVTVTGHSLGGTLTQIAGHHFGLRGETFSAYGAVSLGYDTGGGGGSIVNHVRARDTVSAASPYLGLIKMCASAW